jgi:hypothetical protein
MYGGLSYSIAQEAARKQGFTKEGEVKLAGKV